MIPDYLIFLGATNIYLFGIIIGIIVEKLTGGQQ